MTQQTNLSEYVAGTIWLAQYKVRFMAMDLSARMSVLRLSGRRLMLHSPCEMSDDLVAALNALGKVAFIVAPGNFHHLNVASAQAAFPEARTYICPGIEKKRPDLPYDEVLGNQAPAAWRGEVEQVLIEGSRFIQEVAFYHIASRTMLLVDLIENVTDSTLEVDWKLKFWWKAVFHMWNHPKPAPEYQIGWRDRRAAAASLKRMLEWDFQRIIIAHGDLIEHDARAVARAAWAKPLKHAPGPA